MGTYITYEVSTALAFLAFRAAGVDHAVIEVGLGGRLDATNVVEPMMTAITSISYDHMAILGNTLGEIAGEKAGIIKEGVPVVCSAQAPEAITAIERVAAMRHAPLVRVGPVGGSCDYTWSPGAAEQTRQFFDRHDANGKLYRAGAGAARRASDRERDGGAGAGGGSARARAGAG